MSRRVNFFGVFAISGLCILLIFASKQLTTTIDSLKPRDIGRNGIPRLMSSSRNTLNANTNRYHFGSDTVPPIYNANLTIEGVLKEQHDKIVEEMAYFEYPEGRFGVDAEKLSDLQMVAGGKPYRSIIITSWRSGSTFLGDVLNALPGNFYHYEPLLPFDIQRIRGQPNDEPAIRNLKKLLNCDYNDMDEYLEFGRTHNYLFSHNTRLSKYCNYYPQYCYEPKFLNGFCKLFPLQSMKVVRLQMSVAARLLEDDSLNTVRIILLIRDPRGSLQSRKHRVWCPGHPDCDDPMVVCNDMSADYYTAINLSQKYPTRFRAIRYEDLSLNPYDMSQDLLQFYGFTFDDNVQNFLDSHTKVNIGGVSSTFRDSKSAPFHWTKDLRFEEILNIQESCTEALQLWGYKKATNESELYNNFNPLLPFPFS